MGCVGERSIVSKSLSNSKERKNDIIYTPDKLAQVCVDSVPFVVNDKVLDPFYGSGAFYNKFPDYVDKSFTEIQPPFNKDFFDYDQEVDWCVSNPPFSKLNKVFEKSIEISRKGFAYITASHNITNNRMAMLRNANFGLTGFAFFFVPEWFGFPCMFTIWEKNKPSIELFECRKYSFDE